MEFEVHRLLNPGFSLYPVRLEALLVVLGGVNKVGTKSPESKDVFPDPTFPMIAINCPFFTVRLMFSSVGHSEPGHRKTPFLISTAISPSCAGSFDLVGSCISSSSKKSCSLEMALLASTNFCHN